MVCLKFKALKFKGGNYVPKGKSFVKRKGLNQVSFNHGMLKV